MNEMPIRIYAINGDTEKMLRLCADDPMWDAHAEVSKALLVRAADELALLRKMAGCSAPFEALETVKK